MNSYFDKISNSALTMSWPFEEAEKILQKFPNKKEIILETGYGPSGFPHIGTFGEVFRSSVIANALNKIARDIKIKIIVVSDDMDGLQKIPNDFPNQEMLKKHLNKPLTMVPDPFDIYESYGHHMNSFLCKFLDLFEFDYEFKSATECYKSGVFDEKLLLILKNYDKVMNIMLPSFREERKKTYSPFLPICPKTSKVLQVPIIEKNIEKGTVMYKDINGEKIEVLVTKGGCKLQWKPDWGMRWAAFGVNYETHGKDLITSAILSSQICKILGGNPPILFSYEFFLDREGKKISKSIGNGISLEKWLTYAPAESLALYIFQNPKRAKRLYFDIIPKLTDEYLGFVKQYNEGGKKDFNNPAWHIHHGNVPNIETSGISFSLLLNLATACNAENKKILWGFIYTYAPNVTPKNNKMLDKLSDFAVRYYLDFIKPTKMYRIPNKKEKEMLLDLKNAMLRLPVTATAEEIQFQIFFIGKKYNHINLHSWFQLLYETLLGQKNGPKMGSFIKLYGINNTISLIEKAVKCVI